MPHASGFGGGVLHSNIVAIDDRHICPGKTEDWKKPWGGS